MPRKNKNAEPIPAPSKPSITPTQLGTGYLSDAAKKAKKKKTELERMLEEANK
jgi:hypothetical protein